jgi:hypothetical protein
VVNNIDTALSIQRKYHQSLRIVTLEGDQLNPGGSISGGSFRNNSNLMGRKRELEEIEEQILKAKNAVESLKHQLAESESRRDLAKASVESHRQEIEKLTLEQNTQTMAIASQINVEYSSLSTRTDFVTENLHRLNSELEDVTAEKGNMEDSQQNSDNVLAEKNQKICRPENGCEGAQVIVIADFDFVETYTVVFIDDGYNTFVYKSKECVADVERAVLVLKIILCEKQLAYVEVLLLESLTPLVHKLNLADCAQSLAVMHVFFARPLFCS